MLTKRPSAIERTARLYPLRTMLGFDVERTVYPLRTHPKLGPDVRLLIDRLRDKRVNAETLAVYRRVVEACREEVLGV